MPEGPEVEIVRLGLLKTKKLEVKGVIFSNHKKYAEQPFRTLLNKKLIDIKRKGKWLIFYFEKGIKSINHLGMSGKWLIFEEADVNQESFCFSLDFKNTSKIIKEKKLIEFLKTKNYVKARSQKINYYSSPAKGQRFLEEKKSRNSLFDYLVNDRHIKLVLFFEKGIIAVFSDPRIFGEFTIINNKEKEKRLNKIMSFGPDILDNPFDEKLFLKKMRKHPKMKVGSALLKPEIVLGVGNIYRSEGLFLAKISPFRKVKALADDEIFELGKALSVIGRLSLENGGSSIQNYINTSGETGRMQEKFKVYGKEGKPCPNCGNEIRKDKLEGRSIYWCSFCQK